MKDKEELAHVEQKALIAVDVAMFAIENGRLMVLLQKREKEPARGRWALPGVLLREGERSDEAARRALIAKGGVEAGWLEQLRTFDALERDSRQRCISVAHICAMPIEQVQVNEEKKNSAKLVEIKEALGLGLPFDHNEILEAALERLRSKVGYSSLPAHFLPEKFTLPQLQNVYEAVLGQNLDKSAFRRKIMEAGFVEEAGDDKARQGASRPAQLYRLKIEPGQKLAIFRRALT